MNDDLRFNRPKIFGTKTETAFVLYRFQPKFCF